MNKKKEVKLILGLEFERRKRLEDGAKDGKFFGEKIDLYIDSVFIYLDSLVFHLLLKILVLSALGPAFSIFLL